MSTADLARHFARARKEGRMLAPDPSVSIGSVADAYAIQTELAQIAGGEVRGWKVTALAAADQAKFSSTQPVAGALLGAYVDSSPAMMPLRAFVAPLLECEVAFLLASDLPQRSLPYTREDVEGAIAAVLPVFEVADSRVPASAPDLLKLADAMGNGALIAGEPVSNWRTLDLTSIAITLSIDGAAVAQGTSARILGDPLLAVLALANAQPLPAGGLKAGQIVTTGTCTDPLRLRAGEFVGQFGVLGEVRARFLA